jgi:hypothetical protein
MSTTATTNAKPKPKSKPKSKSKSDAKPKPKPETDATSKANATYLYCVVKGAAPPAAATATATETAGAAPARSSKAPKKGKAATTKKAAAGLAAAGPARAIDVGDGYHVVVSTVPLSIYSSEAIEEKLRDLDWVGAAASAHEAVVERAGESGTVVPMKLFTIFSSDERAADHVRKMKRGLDKVVAKIAGCEEWGLRILFDETRAAKVNATKVAAAPKLPVTGTGFLLRKKAHEESRRRLTSQAKHEVDDLFVRLDRTAKSSVRRPPLNRELAGQVMLDAVFLVPAGRVEKFKSTVASSAQELADDGYHVTLTGPWPAYSFIGDA